MICPNCHFENKEGAKFCNECGFPLSGRIAAVAAAADEALQQESTVDHSEEDSAEIEIDPTTSTEESHADTVERQSTDDHADDKTALTHFDDAEEATETDSSKEPDEWDELEESPFLPIPRVPAAHMPESFDPARLPAIDVAWVNVDEDGNGFDIDPFDGSEHELQTGSTSVRTDAPARRTFPEDASITADLSGLNECLVDAGYMPPQASWSSGGTMEMPRIEGDAAPKQKDFRAPDPHEKKAHGKGRIAAVILIVLASAAALALGITYHMELWGGKVLPDVVGMTQSDATYVLENKSFSVRTTQVKSDETEGVVLLMDPGAGSRQEKGTEVVIHVAAARVIPDVVGKTKGEAMSLLAQEGFDNVAISTERSDEPEDSVLSISPEVSSKQKSSIPITVTVAQPYTVPDITGKTYDDALAALEADSYEADVEYVYTEDVNEGLVIGTNPAAGEKLASGSTVVMQIAKSRANELISVARSYLTGAGTIVLGGTTYEIISVDSVTYAAPNQTAFTITGTAVTTLDGETVRGSARQKSGVLTWNDANQLESIA